ncbi:MAG: PRC-barrel domain-containing protein [Phycisphaerales bacterium]
MKFLKIVFVLTLCSAVFAQTSGSQGSSSGSMSQSSTAGPSQIISCKDLMGTEVMSSDGQKCGKIKEVIGDNSQSTARYIIISGSKLHPVPWTATTVTSKESKKSTGETERMDANDGKKKMSMPSWHRGAKDTVTLNISKEQFDRAPTIENTDVEQFSNTSLQQQIDSFYSTSSSGMSGSSSSMSGSTNFVKLSDTIGLKVKDAQNEHIGKIKDVAIDSQKGNLAFGLVSYGGTMSGKIAAVPWKALTINTEEKFASLDATTDKLDTVVLEGGDISRLSNKQFANRVYESFGEQPYWGVYGYEPGQEQQQKKPYDANKPMRDVNDANRGMNKGSEI